MWTGRVPSDWFAFSCSGKSDWSGIPDTVPRAEENGANESGNYKEAIRCFAQLPLDSKQYKEAQSILLKSSDAYCEEIAETAEKYVQNGEYEIALELLENAQALLPNAAELQELHNTTYAAYRTFISTTAIEGAE